MNVAMNKGDIIEQRLAFGEALVELALDYPKLVVFDSDVCASTQTKLFRDKFPERFYQMGIAEANMIGVAAGMATLGFTPFVSAFAVSLAKRALDQIRISIAHTQLPVKLNAAYGGLPTGRAGATHSSVQDIAIMRAMPNMTVIDPADPWETKLAVKLALDTPGPVYLRTVRCHVPVIFDGSHKMKLGKAVTFLEGNDIAIISCGMMTPKALAAGNILRKEGIHARIIHAASIKPIDRELIISASRECGHIITVENHSKIGGLGSAVAEVITEEAPCFLTRLGFPDIFMESGDDEAIFSKMGINTENIVQTVKRILKENKT